MLSEGELKTAQAGELLAQVCRQFRERANAQPELKVAVELSETRGSVDFGWGRCTLEADSEALHLRVEAEQAEDLERLQELLTRHVERHSSAAQTALVWDNRDEGSRSPRDPHRKDLMRSFHRRARHS
jgi:hypothetical protein